MYANYWGLAEIPFKNTLDTRWFYESSGHEEALARLMYLIEHHRRCGVLSGPAGTGKSLVLELVRREAVRTGGEVALVDLLGLTEREMLWAILAGLGLAPADEDSSYRLWRTLDDHVLASRHAQSPLILVLDHLDRAFADCIVAVERLHRLSAGGHTGLTLVLAVSSERAAGLGPTLRAISDLRIEVPALDREQTQQYIETLLSRAGADRPLFDSAALDRLFDDTHGIPREVNRLCDLSLLAGMADEAEQIDDAIVSAAAEELHVRLPADRPPFRQRFTAGV
jgi:type II secretory pathway predicted ATPase ExeA